MIDWHSHILPQMDDGSASVDESIDLFAIMIGQGVDTVIATPHFYANNESVDSFLERRAKSYGQFSEGLLGMIPKVLLGAEVSYYPGISRLEGLSRLCIEGTDLLLLEMPFARWSKSVVREVIEIATQRSVTVILAHIERYIDMQSGRVFDELREYGVLMQVNASFFLRASTRRHACRLLSSGKIHLIGSDTHNTKLRPPMLDEAYTVITKKFGEDFADEVDEFGRFLLFKICKQ